MSSYRAKKSYTWAASGDTIYTQTTPRQAAWKIIQNLAQMRLLLREFHLIVENKDIKIYVVNIDDLNDIMRICGKIGKNA
jgi:hypothetical protein